MKYCPNCGKELNENADVCLNCGKLLTNNKRINKQKKGFSIASMVLGIISVLWTISMLLSLEQGIETLKVELYYNEEFIFFIFYFIGYTMFSLTPAILALIFGIKNNKENKNGMAISGIIMSVISLISCLFVFVSFLLTTLS